MELENRSADLVKRNLGDFSTSKEFDRKNLVDKILSAKLWLNFETLPHDNALGFCRKLGIENRASLSPEET